MTKRNSELLLLIIAAPIVIVLFAMLVITGGQELSFNTLGVPIGIFVGFFIAHLFMRRLAPEADPAILPITFALSGIGIAFVTRLAPDLAVRQLMWLFLGIALMVIVLLVVRNIDSLGRYKYTIVIIGVLLLLAPLLPGIGTENYGSRIWLSIGSFSFQPGEIAKICIVIFLASYLAQNREMLSIFTWRIGPIKLPSPATLLPLLIMWALAIVIVIFEKDLGSALVLFTVFLTMIYVATGKKFYVVIGIILAVIGALVLWVFFEHVQDRVDIWLDPFSDALGSGYQIVQSLFSLADGGLFGVGIGQGLSENIPVVESDFIFSAIGEETGLLGAAGVLLLYLCFAIRGVLTASRAKSDVSSMMAVGVTSVVVLQAFIIVGGVTRLIPLTGITLPFISQGGSSLVAGFIIVALLLRCGDEGTGISEEITSATAMVNLNSVLGRVSLGKRLRNVLIVFSILFALLVANLTVIMIVQADEYKNMEGNNHTLAKEATVERGTISTSDGIVLAQSILNDDGTYRRVYPAGDLASQVVGYYSQQYGTSGIEATYNDTLQGEENFATWGDVINSYAGVTTSGNDITLTIDSEIQQAAQDALEGYTGACVVMDPNTGEVLALASSPTYDAADFAEVLEDENSSSVLYNRATQALYPPGSTFKIVTLTSAFENDVANENTIYSSPASIDIGNAEVTNFNNASYGSITLRRATEVSSNTVFGQLGVAIGSGPLVATSEQFGFNQNISFDIPLVTSLMPNPDEMTTWETAWAAAGEPVGEHESPAGPQATVLEMALVGCAIANDGTIMQPYLVDGIYNSNGVHSYTAIPQQLFRATDEETADRVLNVLEGVVENGTGTRAAVDGAYVAGKTGTAENGEGVEDSSWFIGIAGDEDSGSDDPSVVVAIMLENVGREASGSEQAHDVIETTLEVQGIL